MQHSCIDQDGSADEGVEIRETERKTPRKNNRKTLITARELA